MYWKGKKRDAHTINRLSESKFKKVVQYDSKGSLIKIWKSIKDASIHVLNDYSVKNHRGKSELYNILRYKKLQLRLCKNSYWFRESDLIELYVNVPNNLAFEKHKNFDAPRAKRIIKNPKTHTSKYSVNQFDNDGNLINTFRSIKHAGYELKISSESVKKICSSKYKNAIFNLKYGEKTMQPVNESYPKYETIPFRIKKSKSGYRKTRTWVEILFLDSNQNIIERFNNINNCSNKLKLHKTLIYRKAKNNIAYNLNGKIIYFKFGEKKQHFI